MLSTGVELSLQAFSDLCEHAKSILQSLRPRTVSTTDVRRPVVIYTDGAFGDGLADWGAIVIDPFSDFRCCFAGKVPDFLLEAWHRLIGEQLICQIEMYAVLCVRWHLRHRLHRRALLFIDNEPCRYCLIKGRSPSDPLFRLAHACSCLEGTMPCYLWYERIASYCNPADLPSRRKIAEACTRWNLDFGGDIILPGELLTTIVDGEPFPKACWNGNDTEWISNQRGQTQRSTN